MNCPNCQSDDWKLASVVHTEGMISVNTSTIGSTKVSNRELHKSNTTGSHQTVASQKAAPPLVPPQPVAPDLGGNNTVLSQIFKFIFVVFVFVTLFKDFPVQSVILVCLIIYFWEKISSTWKTISEQANKDSEAAYAEKMVKYQSALANYEKWTRTRICQRCGIHYEPK